MHIEQFQWAHSLHLYWMVKYKYFHFILKPNNWNLNSKFVNKVRRQTIKIEGVHSLTLWEKTKRNIRRYVCWYINEDLHYNLQSKNPPVKIKLSLFIWICAENFVKVKTYSTIHKNSPISWRLTQREQSTTIHQFCES